MVESTHCIVPVDLAGQEFRGARGHACLVSTMARTSLLGRHWTENQMEQICTMESSPKMERGYICAIYHAGHMSYKAQELWPGWPRNWILVKLNFKQPHVVSDS